MPPGDPRLLVTLQTGESHIGFMRFLPGQPVAAITVGTQGNWPINAPGVTRVHLSLVFNGQVLYVAAQSPNGPVSINGTPIDGRWWTLSAPAELRFGQACLRVTYETPSTAPGLMQRVANSPPVEGQGGGTPTKLDDAAQWLLRHPDEPPPEKEKVTLLYDPALHAQRPAARSDAPPPAGRVPTPPPAQRAAPVDVAPRMAPTEMAARAAPPAPDHAASGPPSAGEPPMVSTMRRPTRPGEPPGVGGFSPPAGQGAVPPERPGSPLLPAGSGSETIAVNASVWVDRALKGKDPLANVIRTPAPPPWSPESSPMPDDALPAGVPGSKPAGALLAAWRSASVVKKIIFCLLPLAIIAVLLPEPKPPPGPDASVRAVPSSSGSGSALARVAKPTDAATTAAAAAMTSAADAGLGATAVASDSPSANAVRTGATPEAKPTAAAGATSSAVGSVSADATERAAIDAAFEGRWLVAVRLYDGLAASHPDQPAFREAARILRETKNLPH